MQEQEPISLPLKWEIPDHIVSRYATNMLVQETNHEYIVMFFEAHPPITFTAQEIEDNISKGVPVVAECVARVIVARERLHDFVNVLQNVLDRGKEDADGY